MSYPGSLSSGLDFSDLPGAASAYPFPSPQQQLPSFSSSMPAAAVLSGDDLAERLLQELSTIPDGSSRPGTPPTGGGGAAGSPQDGSGPAGAATGAGAMPVFTTPMAHLLATTSDAGGSVMNPVFLSSVIRCALRDVLLAV